MLSPGKTARRLLFQAQAKRHWDKARPAERKTLRDQVAKELAMETQAEAGAESLDLGSATYTKMLSRRL